MGMALETGNCLSARIIEDSRFGPEMGVDAVICVLRELADFLESMADDQYAQKPVGPIQSSIGGHVRHCLDHVAALLVASRTGTLNYDLRERGTDIENDRRAAVMLIFRQMDDLKRLHSRFHDRPIRLRALLSPGAPELETSTTISRELAFVLSHTVHHNSLIAVAASLLGLAVPARFGYAPATLDWMDRQPCAR